MSTIHYFNRFSKPKRKFVTNIGKVKLRITSLVKVLVNQYFFPWFDDCIVMFLNKMLNNSANNTICTFSARGAFGGKHPVIIVNAVDFVVHVDRKRYSV